MSLTLEDLELAEDISRFYDDPLGFVIYAFPWDTDPSLQICELPEPYSLYYDSKYGPDRWACEYLEELGNEIKKRGFDGVTAVDPMRFATCSGHGIGKSTLVAWLIMFIMSTRPYCRGKLTANTGDQLHSTTWSELAKWKNKAVTGHWFRMHSSKQSMMMYHVDHKESWRIDAHTCKEENSEAFAGQHAANSTSFYIFDEASAIPAKIWEVAEGGQTDGEPMWFVFGNPTRNSGRFYDCFHDESHRWITRAIDSRNVAITNKKFFNELVETYGEDSDIVRVRVRGVFPRASSLQFIAADIVDGAIDRETPQQAFTGLRAVLGIDVARYGYNKSVVYTRIGRDARSIPPFEMVNAKTHIQVEKIARHIDKMRELGMDVTVFIDASPISVGVIDGLEFLGYEVTRVHFGGKADNEKLYVNKRNEMWDRLKKWLELGAIPENAELKKDLTVIECSYNDRDQLMLERKKDLVARGEESPDHGDGLALTFAFPVVEFKTLDAVHGSRAHSSKKRDYNPYEQINRQSYDRLYHTRNKDSRSCKRFQANDESSLARDRSGSNPLWPRPRPGLLSNAARGRASGGDRSVLWRLPRRIFSSQFHQSHSLQRHDGWGKQRSFCLQEPSQLSSRFGAY